MNTIADLIREKLARAAEAVAAVQREAERRRLLAIAPHAAAVTSTPSLWPMAVLAVARAELGKGESGSNNRGADVVRYRRGVDDAGAWCAAFGSYCIEEGWANLWRAKNKPPPRCPVKRSTNAKTLGKNILLAGGKRLELPELGAAGIWHRGAADAPTGHFNFVNGVEEDGGSWESLDGNKGVFPSKVKTFNHVIGEPGFLYFARLPEVIV